MPETTKKDFEIFKKECQLWIRKLGLSDWEVIFCFEALVGNDAQCNWNVDSRTAVIYLNVELDICTQSYVKILARHEIFELLLADISSFSRRRYNVNEIDIERAGHIIISRLENMLNKTNEILKE